jgi:hypothetical protein
MRLKALDQIHISTVQSDTIRPGQEFEVSDALGSELLKKHPKVFRRVSARAERPAAAESAPQSEAAPASPSVSVSNKQERRGGESGDAVADKRKSHNK